MLAPIIFAIYFNDIDEGVSSYMNLFADNAKLLARIQNEEDSVKLEQDLEKIWYWSLKWEMEINVKKCSVMEFVMSRKRITSDYKLGNEIIKNNYQKKVWGYRFQTICLHQNT